jgi:hypothetical protein
MRRFPWHVPKEECAMRRFMSSCLLAVALLGGAVSMTGCVVVPPRHARVWVPGYWDRGHVWVGPHWRYR